MDYWEVKESQHEREINELKSQYAETIESLKETISILKDENAELLASKGTSALMKAAQEGWDRGHSQGFDEGYNLRKKSKPKTKPEDDLGWLNDL